MIRFQVMCVRLAWMSSNFMALPATIANTKPLLHTNIRQFHCTLFLVEIHENIHIPFTNTLQTQDFVR
jgi:hypothetical protein